MNKKNINFFLMIFVLFLLLFLFCFSIPLFAQSLTYKEVKSQGIILESNLKTHKIFIIIGNLSSEYLFCDIYVFGSYFLDFSGINSGKLIFKDGFREVFIQFASYKKLFNPDEQYQYIESFQIRLKEEDINKILENKKDDLYLQFNGKFGSINCKIDQKLINSLEKLSFEDDQSQSSLSINSRPYTFFTIFYPFNIYYSFDEYDEVIDDIAFSPLFSNNITFEIGFYLKLPYLSAISIYTNVSKIFDYKTTFQSTVILGVKTYFTIFDIPQVSFLRLSILLGIGSCKIGDNIIIDSLNDLSNFYYYFSLVAGVPISSNIEYIISLSLGNVESTNLALLFQVAMIVNLF